MPPYQKQSIIATRRLRFTLIFITLILLFAATSVDPSLALDTVLNSSRGRAQQESEDPAHLLLLPQGESSLELLTHTADIDIDVPADGNPLLSVSAIYRLHNPARDPLTAVLQVNPVGSHAESLRLPRSIQLLVDGQNLELQPTGVGLQQVTSVNFGADSRRNFELQYAIPLQSSHLVELSYPLGNISEWGRPPGSWRVTLQLPQSGTEPLLPDDWLQIEPDGWSFDGDQVEWLSESPPTTDAIVFQFIHPQLSTQIRQAARQSTESGNLATFLELGDLYRGLYRSPRVDEAARERFYAQTLAAYEMGIRRGEETGAEPILAQLYVRLAALYRSRSVGTAGEIDPVYIRLMIDTIDRALAGSHTAVIPKEEIEGWLAEGLQIELRIARAAGRWEDAEQLLDRLRALPREQVDQARLSEEERTIALEQALLLVRQNEIEAALTLVDGDIPFDTLQAPAADRTPFSRWRVEILIDPSGIDLVFKGSIAPDRHEQATRVLDELRARWQSVDRDGWSVERVEPSLVRITVSHQDQRQRLALAQATPAGAEWSLVRTVVANSRPSIEQSAYLIWSELSFTEQVDLRTVADEWRSIAAGLERQAAVSLSSATAGQPIEDRLTGELARYFRSAEAERWRNLVDQSSAWVRMQDPSSSQLRSWVVRLDEAPQQLRFQVDVVQPLRLLMALAILFLSLLGLTGLLWLLIT